MRLPTDLQHAKGDDTNGSTSGTNWPVTITNINALRVTATTLGTLFGAQASFSGKAISMPRPQETHNLQSYYRHDFEKIASSSVTIRGRQFIIHDPRSHHRYQWDQSLHTIDTSGLQNVIKHRGPVPFLQAELLQEAEHVISACRTRCDRV
jgi:hypothetical protein